jgi:hypothetical protein
MAVRAVSGFSLLKLASYSASVGDEFWGDFWGDPAAAPLR